MLLDKLILEIPLMKTFDGIVLQFAVHLAIKYPLLKTQDLCTFILHRLQSFNHLTSDQAPIALDIAVNCLCAFPTLMPLVVPLLGKWSAEFSGDPAFAAVIVSAASHIGQITAAVNAPIYRRSTCRDR